MGHEPESGNSHLEWEYKKEDNRHYAINSDAEDCGYLHLRQWGRHTHWSWRQTNDFDMSPGCLEEVRKKQKELFKDRKLK